MFYHFFPAVQKMLLLHIISLLMGRKYAQWLWLSLLLGVAGWGGAQDNATREASICEVSIREASIPQVSTREASVCEVSVREASIPQVSAREASVCEVSIRDTSIPQVLASEASVCEASIPQVSAREAYILKYKDLAIKQMQEYGIPASITLGQACVESGNGTSRLAREGNNHFGIKCHDWKGKTIKQTDDAQDECFRKYSSVEESFKDHAAFLRYRGRYAFLFDLSPFDYQGWARGLKQAGYATNPQYAEILIRVIEENKLYEYDRMATDLPDSPRKLEEPVVIHPDVRSPLYTANLARTIYQQNQVAYIVSQPGDTYASLALEFRLFTREILRFNDLTGKQKVVNGKMKALSGDEALEVGTVVYVAQKRKQAAKGLPVHIVEGDETLHALAQRYGVRLSSICTYNRLSKNAQLYEGKEIVMRKNFQ